MKKQNLIFITIIIILVILAVYSVFFIKPEKQESIVDDATTDPFLWKIEGDNPSYLFGSIHLGSDNLLTLPDVVVEGLDEVDVVYTEVKLDQDSLILSDQLSRLSGGQTVEDLLPDDVFEKLESFLISKGLTTPELRESLYVYKIWAVSSTITLLYELEYLIDNPSLDQYIWNKAVLKGKETNGIETVEEQINIFDNFTIEEQTQMLEDTLDDLVEYENQGITITDLMIETYLDGDLEKLLDLSYSEEDENDPLYIKFEQTLLNERNINMTQRIDDLITNNPETQYFFTIGAAHYYGENGIISLLEDKGYLITRVEFNECDSCDDGVTMINDRCYYPYISQPYED